MGCGESKDKLPTLLCFFEFGNDDQKNYCIKLKDSFRHQKPIRFEIKSSPGISFSIQFKLNGETHKIQTIYNEEELENSLNRMYDLLNNADGAKQA